MSTETERLSVESIVKLRQVAEAATPGPWLAASSASSICGLPVVGPGGRMICEMTLAKPWPEQMGPSPKVAAFNAEQKRTAAHIAAFDPPTVLALLAEVTAGREALEMTGCKDAAELIDMANVGKSLLERIADLTKAEGPFKGWMPADDPAEIVFDLVNHYEERPAPTDQLEWVREALNKYRSAIETRRVYQGTNSEAHWQRLVSEESQSRKNVEAKFAALSQPSALGNPISEQNQSLVGTDYAPAPMKTLVDQEWLRRKVEADPDMDTDAGELHPEAPRRAERRQTGGLGPYRAEFGAIHDARIGPGFIFTVNPPAFADDVAAALNKAALASAPARETSIDWNRLEDEPIPTAGFVLVYYPDVLEVWSSETYHEAIKRAPGTPAWAHLTEAAHKITHWARVNFPNDFITSNSAPDREGGQ
jgi:hypothetical protein